MLLSNIVVLAFSACTLAAPRKSDRCDNEEEDLKDFEVDVLRHGNLPQRLEAGWASVEKGFRNYGLSLREGSDEIFGTHLMERYRNKRKQANKGLTDDDEDEDRLDRMHEPLPSERLQRRCLEHDHEQSEELTDDDKNSSGGCRCAEHHCGKHCGKQCNPQNDHGKQNQTNSIEQADVNEELDKVQHTQALQGRSPTCVDPNACDKWWPTRKPDFNAIPKSCGVSWLDTINTWRGAYNKSPLAWSPRLAEIAWNAGVSNQGGAQIGIFKHTDLRAAGSHGEVETPGYVIPPPGINLFGSTPFEGAVLAWLCEVPGPQLLRTGVDLCNLFVKQTNNINVAGQRGHYDAFLTDYKQVGCSFTFNAKNPSGLFAGAYVCDYGY